jgi:DNA-binding transcriptional ArsR family regulator
VKPAFLERFERVTPAGEGKWRARCPHCGSDRGASFSEAEDRYLYHPFCPCPPRDVLAVVELHFDDLLYESNATRPRLSFPSRGVSTSTGVVVDPSTVESRGEVEELLQRHSEGRIGALPHVQLPPLPDNATDPMRRVAAFFELVHGLRQWAGMDPEVMFSSHWAAAKIGLPQRTVSRALGRLVDAGVLAPAGSRPGRNGRRGPRLFNVGDGIASQAAPPNVVRLVGRRAA